MAACVMLLNIAPRRAVPLARTRPLLFDCCVMRHDGRAGKVSVTACSSGKPARPSMASHFISTFLQKTSLALEIKLLSCWQINSPLTLAVSPTTSRWRTAQLMSSDIIHQITGFTRPIWSGWQAARGSSSGCAQIKRGARLPFISIWRYCTLRHWLKISSCWSYTAVFTSQIPSMDENRLSWE